MKWEVIKVTQPTQEGKYVVKTLTMAGSERKVECQCTINKGKASFGVTNQVVTHWLNENI